MLGQSYAHLDEKAYLMTHVSVIVVNYNSSDMAISAVESVLARTHGGIDVDVHLVDNASPNGDAAVLREKARTPDWQQRVNLYSEDTNHGFGRGNNVVLETLATRELPPDYIFLLNPDAELENEAIAVLADFMDKSPGTGAAGARIEEPGSVPSVAAFRFPSMISEFSGALSFGPISRLFARWHVPMSEDMETQQVDWVVGAAVMFRFKALREIGFFDPAYFLYYEEVDLMRQMSLKGWQTWYVDEAKVIHVGGAVTGLKNDGVTRSRFPYYWYESWAIYFHKNHGRCYALLTAVGWMLGAALNILLSRLRGKAPHAPLHLFRDFWAMAGRPLVGLKSKRYD